MLVNLALSLLVAMVTWQVARRKALPRATTPSAASPIDGHRTGGPLEAKSQPNASPGTTPAPTAMESAPTSGTPSSPDAVAPTDGAANPAGPRPGSITPAAARTSPAGAAQDAPTGPDDAVDSPVSERPTTERTSALQSAATTPIVLHLDELDDEARSLLKPSAPQHRPEAHSCGIDQSARRHHHHF